MRNIIAGIAVLGALAIGAMAPASAHPLTTSPVTRSHAIQQADWGSCGSACQEHRGAIREHEQERQRVAQHRGWEEHQRGKESRYPSSPAHGYQHRY